MTEDNITEVEETEGAASESNQDNELIKSLRAQIKDKDKALKAQPSASDIEAQVRASVARELAIENELVGLNQPRGLRPLIEEKLGDAEVTPEGITEALKAIGFEITDSADGGENQQVSEQVAQVSQLGSAVANASANDQTREQALDNAIAAAETPAELDRVMREAGLAG